MEGKFRSEGPPLTSLCYVRLLFLQPATLLSNCTLTEARRGGHEDRSDSGVAFTGLSTVNTTVRSHDTLLAWRNE
jgi:hypothetical protein